MYGHVVIACLFGVALAAPSQPLGQIAVGVDSVSVPRYDFNYAVSDPVTGDNKAQQEVREGGVVRGSYSLSEPDGTVRIVNYQADPVTGFNAVVKRVGPAAHPQTLVAPVIAKQVVTPVVSNQIISPISQVGLISPISNLGINNLGLGWSGLGLSGIGLSGIGLSGVGLGGLGHLDGHGIGLGGWKH